MARRGLRISLWATERAVGGLGRKLFTYNYFLGHGWSNPL